MVAVNPTYFERLAARCEAAGTSLCIGLDPEPDRMPRHLPRTPEGIYRFLAEIIEATAEYAAAFKPNIAFFESIGVEGYQVLSQSLRHVPPSIPVIIDAKRGDIGSTGRHYARALFERLRADAVTINPYMGSDSVKPFLERAQKAAYLLCLTSNPGAADFQLKNDLYLRVARKASDWNRRGNVGLVVGATQLRFLPSIHAVAPELPLLMPGVGAQGGEPERVVETLPRLARHQMLFNVTRTVIYAGSGADFARVARQAACEQNDRIEAARRQAPPE